MPIEDSNAEERPALYIDADPANANWLRIVGLARQYEAGEVTREEVEERLKLLAGDRW